MVCWRKSRRDELAQRRSARGLTFGIVAGLLILFEFLLWPRKTLFRVWRLDVRKPGCGAYLAGAAYGAAGRVARLARIGRHADDRAGRAVCHRDRQRHLGIGVATIPASRHAGASSRRNDLYANRRRHRRISPGGAALGGGHLRCIAGGVRGSGGLPAERGSGTANVAANFELLQQAFVTVIEPYLSTRPPGGSALADGARAANFFRGLRDQLPAGAHPAIDRLETYCDERRQFARQARLHFWLHNWLWVHLPLSAALVVLMLVHVFVAVKFW